MELEFRWNDRDGWVLLIAGDNNEYPVVPKREWLGEGVTIVADHLLPIGSEATSGDLWLTPTVHGTHDPRQLASIVCTENRKFFMTIGQFRISDEYFNPGALLDDTLSFKLPASFINTAEILSDALLTYRQLRVFRQFFKTNKAVGELRRAEGVVLFDKLADKHYLLTNHNRTPLEAVWQSEIPEALSEDEEGALYLYEPMVRKDQIMVNASAFFYPQ